MKALFFISIKKRKPLKLSGNYKQFDITKAFDIKQQFLLCIDAYRIVCFFLMKTCFCVRSFLNHTLALFWIYKHFFYHIFLLASAGFCPGKLNSKKSGRIFILPGSRFNGKIYSEHKVFYIFSINYVSMLILLKIKPSMNANIMKTQFLHKMCGLISNRSKGQIRSPFFVMELFNCKTSELITTLT